MQLSDGTDDDGAAASTGFAQEFEFGLNLILDGIERLRS